jgi:NitT/TauT family transport system permease protein
MNPSRPMQRGVALAGRDFGWVDLVVLLALVGLLATLAWLGQVFWAPLPPEPAATLDLSPWRLPYYAVRSLFRMFAALAASLAFTFLVGSWAARSPRASRVLVPLLDILQSVPVLGFLSATVTFFLALAPGRVLGLELASIFAVFTAQVWNLTFAFYQSLVALPREQAEAVRLFRLSAWRRFTHLELPAAVIPLVWNGMMSFGGGWFFLAASEAITARGHEWLLPGLGSYVAVAAKQGDLAALGFALAAMAGVILLVDRGFFRPLVAWSDRFRLEESAPAAPPRSGLLAWLRRSRALPRVAGRLARVDDLIDRLWRPARVPKGDEAEAAGASIRDRAVTAALWAATVLLALRGAAFVATEVAWPEAARVAGLGALTLLRVAAVTAAAGILWTPIGVWIGLDPRVARVAQPVAQLLAAFPANFLFPFVTVAFLRLHASLEWGAALLMALGAQWYVVFNTIAGAATIPTDLREMARCFGLRGRAWWRALILPGIFPSWVTGALTAAGGAWNASIVAEVVTWGDARLTATGIGSYITEASAAGDGPRVALGVAVMSAYVVATNWLVWRRLARLAERRYALG